MDEPQLLRQVFQCDHFRGTIYFDELVFCKTGHKGTGATPIGLVNWCGLFGEIEWKAGFLWASLAQYHGGLISFHCKLIYKACLVTSWRALGPVLIDIWCARDDLLHWTHVNVLMGILSMERRGWCETWRNSCPYRILLNCPTTSTSTL